MKQVVSGIVKLHGFKKKRKLKKPNYINIYKNKYKVGTKYNIPTNKNNFNITV